jgi:hypothetical protein
MQLRHLHIQIFLLAALGAGAQQVSVNARMDTTNILIGDQIRLFLEVSQPAGMQVGFPNIADTLVNKVEVVNRSEIDTQKSADNRLSLIQKLVITGFDSGLYVIPPFKFTVKNQGAPDTLLTNALTLNVNTFKIDSIKGITDIKPPIDAPFRLSEILNYIIIGLAVIIVALAGYYIYRKYKRKEPIIRRRPKPKEPAHIVALRNLDILTEKKLWQQNRIKEYYTELTDIVRVYIEDRFLIMAMEQVTDEILGRFSCTKLIDSFMYDKLSHMLSLADMVKFAKAIPLPDENDLVLKNAYDFVIKTKQELVLTEPEKDEIVVTENKTEQ